MTLISLIYGNSQPVISDHAISDINFNGKVVWPTTGKEPDTCTPVVQFRVKSLIIKNIISDLDLVSCNTIEDIKKIRSIRLVLENVF